MKLEIKNTYFEKSPLSVSIHIENSTQEGHRSFTLSLTKDESALNKLAACNGVLFDDDMKFLQHFFKELATEDDRLLQFAPMEPSFILRGQNQGDEIELLWIIDQGMAEANYSTDTGVGLLMTISLETLSAITKALTD